MELEALRKKFDRLYGRVDINEANDKQEMERLANLEQIRNGLLQAEDISAHTIDFTEEAQRIKNQNENRKYWDPFNPDNSINHIKILGNLNDSHFDINETAEHLRLLEYRSRSIIIRK